MQEPESLRNKDKGSNYMTFPFMGGPKNHTSNDLEGLEHQMLGLNINPELQSSSKIHSGDYNQRVEDAFISKDLLKKLEESSPAKAPFKNKKDHDGSFSLELSSISPTKLSPCKSGFNQGENHNYPNYPCDFEPNQGQRMQNPVYYFNNEVYNIFSMEGSKSKGTLKQTYGYEVEGNNQMRNLSYSHPTMHPNMFPVQDNVNVFHQALHKNSGEVVNQKQSPGRMNMGMKMGMNMNNVGSSIGNNPSGSMGTMSMSSMGNMGNTINMSKTMNNMGSQQKTSTKSGNHVYQGNSANVVIKIGNSNGHKEKGDQTKGGNHKGKGKSNTTNYTKNNYESSMGYQQQSQGFQGNHEGAHGLYGNLNSQKNQSQNNSKTLNAGNFTHSYTPNPLPNNFQVEDDVKRFNSMNEKHLGSGISSGNTLNAQHQSTSSAGSNKKKVPNDSNSFNKIFSGKNGWFCCICKNFNFEKRQKCNRCNKDKLDEEVIISFDVDEGDTLDSSKKGYKSEVIQMLETEFKLKKPYFERPGDWVCIQCKNLNFAFRINCNRCFMSKQESNVLIDAYLRGEYTEGVKSPHQEQGSSTEQSPIFNQLSNPASQSSNPKGKGNKNKGDKHSNQINSAKHHGTHKKESDEALFQQGKMSNYLEAERGQGTHGNQGKQKAQQQGYDNMFNPNHTMNMMYKNEEIEDFYGGFPNSEYLYPQIQRGYSMNDQQQFYYMPSPSMQSATQPQGFSNPNFTNNQTEKMAHPKFSYYDDSPPRHKKHF